MIGLKDYILLAESDKLLGVEIDIILFLVDNIILMISLNKLNITNALLFKIMKYISLILKYQHPFSSLFLLNSAILLLNCLGSAF